MVSSGLPAGVRAAEPAAGAAEGVEHFRICQTVEYSGPGGQFRTQATGYSECATARGSADSEYRLDAQATVMVGHHPSPLGAKLKPLRIHRDPATEALTLPDGEAVLLVEVMNRVIRQVERGGRKQGAWEQDVALGIGPYMPDKVHLKFSGTPIQMDGVPDALALAVGSDTISFKALEGPGPETILCRFKAVFIYSLSQDRLYQMGSTFVARRGAESLRVECAVLQCDAAGKEVLAPVADLSGFLGLREKPMAVEKEALPPFWTRQACQAFQAVTIAASTAGQRATNFTVALIETIGAVDNLWGAAATVVETVGSVTGVEEVEAWGKAMQSVPTPSKEIKRRLAEVVGEQEAEYLMATVELGAAYVVVGGPGGRRDGAGGRGHGGRCGDGLPPVCRHARDRRLLGP
jgi:hypothetical protein